MQVKPHLFFCYLRGLGGSRARKSDSPRNCGTDSVRDEKRRRFLFRSGIDKRFGLPRRKKAGVKSPACGGAPEISVWPWPDQAKRSYARARYS